MTEWRTSKRIPFGDNEAVFQTLYEDKRDAMCDSLEPEWGISEQTVNRRVRIEGPDGCLVMRMTKEEGNALYREMVKIDNHGYGRAQVRAWVQKKVAEHENKMKKEREEFKRFLGEKE